MPPFSVVRTRDMGVFAGSIGLLSGCRIYGVLTRTVRAVGGVWVFRTVCCERVVLSSPGCLWPGRMDDHEEVFEAHA